MRLWHFSLIPLLPRARLLGQHREVCALRGNGWGKKHSTVDYVFSHSPATLYAYHVLVMEEMRRRGYRVDPAWSEPRYRGRNCAAWQDAGEPGSYPEHDGRYLDECVENLGRKGIVIRVPRAGE